MTQTLFQGRTRRTAPDNRSTRPLRRHRRDSIPAGIQIAIIQRIRMGRRHRDADILQFNGVYRGKDYRHEYGGVSVTSEASQKAPDVPAYIEYAASDQNRIRLSGILRNFFYRDLITSKTRYLAAWGASLSGNFQLLQAADLQFPGRLWRRVSANYLQRYLGACPLLHTQGQRTGQNESQPDDGSCFRGIIRCDI